MCAQQYVSEAYEQQKCHRAQQALRLRSVWLSLVVLQAYSE